METDMSFGRALAEHRKRRGMSRSQLSEAAGLSYPYVSQLETGLRKPSRSAAARLAEALGLHPLDLEAAIPTSDDDQEILRAQGASERLINAPGPSVVALRAESASTGRSAGAAAAREDLIGQMVDLLEEFEADERLDVLADVQKRAMRRMLDQGSSHS